MRKILALIICIVLMCAMSVVVFAEDEIPSVTTVETTTTESLPTSTEKATEGENSGAVAELTTTEKIVSYILSHPEEVTVIVTTILTVFYQVLKHKVLNRSIGTLNNNAIRVAENSRESMQSALAEMGSMSSTVGGYKTDIEALLSAYKETAEEKKKLENTLAELNVHLKQSKLANTEFANELAELLVLANIPNSKKDELYARHIAAVSMIEEVTVAEVNTDDNEQKE